VLEGGGARVVNGVESLLVVVGFEKERKKARKGCCKSAGAGQEK
jgi:hypothetical protein